MATKLVGQNYSTPDLVAKVTGKAKYAEDYMAEGMLICRLLTSPLPHARARNINVSAAQAMPGVKAILLPSDIPDPADTVTDLGQTIKANLQGERALTAEPLYQGEPVVAVAAVDELTAIEAIEKIEIDWEPLPFNVDPLDSLRPGRPTARTQGNVWMRPEAKQGQPPPPPEIQ
jgi:CO/xanthine dehydrogenase Mo-binding subunit